MLIDLWHKPSSNLTPNLHQSWDLDHSESESKKILTFGLILKFNMTSFVYIYLIENIIKVSICKTQVWTYLTCNWSKEGFAFSGKIEIHRVLYTWPMWRENKGYEPSYQDMGHHMAFFSFDV